MSHEDLTRSPTIMCFFDFGKNSLSLAVECSIWSMFVRVVHPAESSECIIDFIFAGLLKCKRQELNK